MTHKRLFVFSTIITGVLVSAVLADSPETSAAVGDASAMTSIQVLRLQHNNAYAVAKSLADLRRGGGVFPEFSVSPVDDSTLVIRTSEELMDDVRRVVGELDQPATPADSGTATAFLSLGAASSSTLGPVLNTLVNGNREQFAIDDVNRRLVVRAAPAVVAQVEAFLKHVDSPPGPLHLEFQFLRGTLGADGKADTAQIPKNLKIVAEALGEGGLRSIEVLAPIFITTGGEGEFSSSSAINRKLPDGRNEVLEFRVNGGAQVIPDTAFARMEIHGQVFGQFGPADQTPDGHTQFDLHTTLTLKLGEFVVLAAAPSTTSTGNAIALAVRVTTD